MDGVTQFDSTGSTCTSNSNISNYTVPVPIFWCYDGVYIMSSYGKKMMHRVRNKIWIQQKLLHLDPVPGLCMTQELYQREFRLLRVLVMAGQKRETIRRTAALQREI